MILALMPLAVWIAATMYFRRKKVAIWPALGGGFLLGMLTSVVVTSFTESGAPNGGAVVASSTARPSIQRMTRDDFINRIKGQSSSDVIAAIGPPSNRQQMDGQPELWYYSGLTYDPLTQKVDTQVQLVMKFGSVERINFY